MQTSVQLDEAAKGEIVREFVRILHNSHEHIEHLRHAYSAAVRGEAKELLLQHIAHEERRNFDEATRLRQRAAGYLDWELKVLQDHSTFIRKVAEGDEIDPEVGLRLLHHFEEEHLEFFQRFGDPEYEHSHEQPEAPVDRTEVAPVESTEAPAGEPPVNSPDSADRMPAPPEEARPSQPTFTVGSLLP